MAYTGRADVAGGEFQNDKIMAAYRAFEADDRVEHRIKAFRACAYRAMASPVRLSAISYRSSLATSTPAGIPGVTAYT